MPHSFDPSISDYFILLAVPLSVWFSLSYALGSPWWRVSKHGWIGVMALLHSFSVSALVFLIAWGVVFGQRVDEYIRLPITAALALALLAKVIILHAERRRGRIMRRERERKYHDPEQVPGGVAAGSHTVPRGLPGRTE